MLTPLVHGMDVSEHAVNVYQSNGRNDYEFVEFHPNGIGKEKDFKVNGNAHHHNDVLGDDFHEREDVSVESLGSEDCDDMVMCIKSLLNGIGEDTERHGLILTPARVVRAFQTATKGYTESTSGIIGNALFNEDSAEGHTGWGGGHGGMVLVQDIETFSCCCTCLLPMKFRCHLAYIPSKNRVVGLSKLPRVADAYSRRLQNPKRFTSQIVKSLSAAFKPLGVAVAVESWHLSGTFCESSNWKEIRYDGKIACAAAEGEFISGDKELLQEFLALISLSMDDCDFETERQRESTIKEEVLCQSVHSESNFLLSEDSEKLDSFSVSKNNGICMNGNEKNSDKERRVKSVGSMVTSVENLLKSLHHGLIHQLECIDLRMSAQFYVNYILNCTKGSLYTLEDITVHVHSSAAAITKNNCMKRKISKPIASESNGCIMSSEDVFDSNSIQRMHKFFSIPFSSLCEHHLLPFFGHVHVGYIPSDDSSSPLELHSLQSIIELYARRLQVQERMTRQIAEAINTCLSIDGVIVVSIASHMCMVSRGIQKMNSFTSSITSLGRFSKNAKLRVDFIKQLPGKENLRKFP